MKIICLDIDGVLNCQDGYRLRSQGADFCRYKEFTNSKGEKDHYQTFYPENKKWINRLIEETGAKIVISSTWRGSGLDWMRDVWKEEGMSGEIIDITPHLYFKNNYSAPRGCEIDQWLKEKGFRGIMWSEEEAQKYIDKSGIENYIIIDDDGDMLYEQRNHFVHVLPAPRNTQGFNEKYYLEAKRKLQKTFIELNYK